MISASRHVGAPPERVFAFLCDLRNHWLLESHFVELEHVEDAGGRVRMRGPLGIARTAVTTVEEAVPHARLRGRAQIGRGTVGRVAWDIEPAGDGSRVTLSARVERASAFDRVLLAVGARVYLGRVFAGALDGLARELG